MIITYHGVEFFRVQFGDVVVAFNPIAKTSKFKGPHFGADIALVSLNHQDMNGVDSVTHGDKKPIAIFGPGEYETKDIFIRGFQSTSKYTGALRQNTIYTVSLENMNLCFLGALGSADISPEIIEALGEIDILFVPIGGFGVLTPAEAYKLAVKLEPKLIIPMHFNGVGEPTALKHFLKEGGEEGLKPTDKLTIKKKDLEGKEGDTVVLESIA